MEEGEGVRGINGRGKNTIKKKKGERTNVATLFSPLWIFMSNNVAILTSTCGHKKCCFENVYNLLCF